MKYTNYTNLHKIMSREEKAILENCLASNTFGDESMTKADVVLLKCILADVEDLESIYGNPYLSTIRRSRKYSEFPETMVGNYMEGRGYKCDNIKTPINEEYLASLENNEAAAVIQPQQQSINVAETNNVIQFIPKNMGYTLLPDGSVKEAQIDDEIKHWYNLYNLNFQDKNCTDNLIMKLRSIIPVLQQKELPNKHSVYQVIDYTNPTNFLLAEVGRGENQILVQNGKVSVTK